MKSWWRIGTIGTTAPAGMAARPASGTGAADDVRPQVEAELADEHERIAGGVEKAVEIGVVDEQVIDPDGRLVTTASIIDVDSTNGHGGQPVETLPR